LNPKELKAKLTAEGFLVFRTLSSEVRLAERVRENLILDSGVAALVSDSGLGVRVAFRSEGSAAPEASTEVHYQRARARGDLAVAAGYSAVAELATPVLDPGDPTRTLDTWYEVAFEKAGLEWSVLLTELRWALSQTRH
jgi:hypothetical protein